MKDSNLRGLKGILALISWFLMSRYSDVLLIILGFDISTLPKSAIMLYSIVMELIPIFIIYKLFESDIKDMFKKFVNNNRDFFNKYFKFWFLALILMMIGNYAIIMLDPSSTANNQESINEMFGNYPVYTFILGVVFAPIIEELVFRLSFRNIFKNKFLYVILSGTIFGLFHVIGSFESAFDFLYVIPYSAPGIVFAYVYLKSKNIFVPIWLHFVHNGTLMAMQFLLLLYGGM